MYILAIETTGAFASVALIKEGKILGSVQGSDRFSHLQNLMPQVKEVIKSCKLSIGDIAAVAVSKGPGSFTGIRIGVSSARALAQTLHIPCIPVSSLQALALRGAEKLNECASGLNSEEKESVGASEDVFDKGTRGSALICPILDARRSQVYGGGYLIKDGFPVEEVKAGPYTIEEFLEAVKDYDNILFMGDGVDSYLAKINEIRPKGTTIAQEAIRYQRAETVAVIGEKIFSERGGLDYNQLKPDYMRMAEAERKLMESRSRAK